MTITERTANRGSGPDHQAASAHLRWRRAALASIVVGSLVVGFALRFFPDTPLWLDEALSVNIASMPIGDIPGALEHDGHPPLYYFLLSAWIDLFGSGDAAVRALSAVFSILSIGLAGLIGFRLGGRKLSIVAVVIMATSPFAIRYATETRMYALVSMLTLVGWLVIERARRVPDIGRLAAVATTSGALLLTHYWSIYFLAAAWILLVGSALRSPDADTRRGSARTAAAIAVGGVFFLPWLPAFLTQLRHTGTPWASASRPTELISESLIGFGGQTGPESMLLLVVLAVLATLAVGSVDATDGNRPMLGFTAHRWIREALAVIGVTIIIGAAVGLATDSAYQSRYAAVWFPLFALLAAAGVARLTGFAFIATLGVVAILGAASVVAGLNEDRTQSADHVEVVIAQGGPDDVVLACPDQLGPGVDRIVDGRRTVYSYPEIDADPGIVDWYDYSDRNDANDPAAYAAQLLERTPADASIWVIWKDDYASLEGQCSIVINELVAAGRVPTTLTQAGERFFENSFLTRLAPA